MSNVISLEAYRFSVRAEGTTILWRGQSLTLTEAEADEFNGALFDANIIGKQFATSGAGFRFIAKDREITIVGRGMGPMKVRRGKEATELGRAMLGATVGKKRGER